MEPYHSIFPALFIAALLGTDSSHPQVYQLLGHHDGLDSLLELGHVDSALDAGVR